jgi:hypothetical protein
VNAPKPAVVVIDPNVRVRGGQTYVGVEDVGVNMEDVGGPVAVGSPVTCREVEDGVDWDGTMASIDESHGIVYIAVDWASGRKVDP